MKATTCGSCEYYCETWGGAYCTNPNSLEYHDPVNEFQKACGEGVTLREEKKELEAKVAELENKHWGECRQIAHYDNELREADEGGYIRKADVLDLITDVQNDGGFKDYSDYSRLWEEVDDMPTTFIELTEDGDAE